MSGRLCAQLDNRGLLKGRLATKATCQMGLDEVPLVGITVVGR